MIFSLGSVCIVLKGSKNKLWQLDDTKQFEWTGGVRVVTPYFANHSTYDCIVLRKHAWYQQGRI